MSEKYYVYLYRDVKGFPRYVGKATDLARSTSHATPAAHNKGLHDWIQEGEHTIEIIGPLENENMAAMIESALISCLVGTPTIEKSLFNKIEGTSRGAFRPLYVPAEMNERMTEPAISRQDLEELQGAIGPLLFVFVGNKSIIDRKGFGALTLPSYTEVAERVEKYWQLQKRVREWSKHVERFPKALVALAGPAENRIVVACLEIELDDNQAWRASDTHPNGLMTVPIRKAREDDLDFRGMRGRRISKDAGLKFNSFRHEQFKIFPEAST